MAGRERPSNLMLSALPESDFQRLEPHLKAMPLRTRTILQKRGDAVDYVYFPTTAVCSIAPVVADGTMVEAAAVGREGIVGIEAFLTAHPVAWADVIVQIPGGAMQMPREEFRRELARGGALQDLSGRYAQAKLAEFIQTVACTALHDVRARCARRLLMLQDRVGQPAFEMSQEFLSMMLAVSRPTVSIAARSLQDAGFIRYHRGHLEIANRRGLEGVACECYAVIRAGFDRAGRVA